VRAKAPGKIVISGAYAVLEGAPALVVAVDRYATADNRRPAVRRTEEIDAAINAGFLRETPWFDASPLRTAKAEGDRKLGLGSSAAILVAALAADTLDGPEPPSHLAEDIFPRALAAHQRAQHGGSGVDVAASCFGGVLRCQQDGQGRLQVEPWVLPPAVVIEVFAYDEAATTAEMVAAVAQFARRSPSEYAAHMDALRSLADEACELGHAEVWLDAMAKQYAALADLGDAAGVPVVDAAGRELAGSARAQGGCFGPAGAGGGDVAVWLGTTVSPQKFRARAHELGLSLLSLRTGVRGVHKTEA
jgi:phosphomevalonate kinase